MTRITTLDLLRGTAVLIMIFANTLPYFFNFRDNNLIRYLFSLAAPIFVVVTGFVTEMNIVKPEINPSKIFLRIVQILFFGVLVDVLFWRSLPFITFDVLYLIAFSQILLFLTNKKYYLSLVIIIFLASFFFNYTAFYRFDIPDLLLTNNNFIDEIIASNPLKRMFYDGWFPMFPWLGFVLLGAISYHRVKWLKQNANSLFLFGILMLVATYFFIHSNVFPVRDNYLELWYPLSGALLFIPCAVVLIMVSLLDKPINPTHILLNFIITIGKNSLFVYTFNAFIISLVLSNEINLNIGLSQKLLITALILLLVTTTTVFLEKLKSTKAWDKLPKFLKFMIAS